METNYIRVEGRAIVVARDSEKYMRFFNQIKEQVGDSNASWADNGIPEEELAAMAGGNGNLILISDVDKGTDAMAVTFDADGKQFAFGITEFVNMGFTVLTKDGRPFTDEEQQKLVHAGESHLKGTAEMVGALCLILPPQNGYEKTRSILLERSAAETCESTREEILARKEAKQRAMNEALGFFGLTPSDFEAPDLS